MKVKVFLSLILGVFLFASCGNEKADILGNIDNLNKEIFTDEQMNVDRAKVQELADNYVLFADKFPDDERSAEFLFKAADLLKNISQSKKSIEIFQRIREQYPDYEKVPMCLFLEAFVYEVYLNDIENARTNYEAFLNQYPEHDFADDAQISLQNLGKSPEELIREFEQKAAQQDTTLVSE